MLIIFFWIIMFLFIPFGIYVNRANWIVGGWNFMLWLAVVLVGLKVFGFHP